MRVRVPSEMMIAQLAEAANLDRFNVRRLLGGRVELRRRGRVLYVRTAELRRRMPAF